MAFGTVCAAIQLQETVLHRKRKWRLFCVPVLVSANYVRLAITPAEFIESLNRINIIQLHKLFLIIPLCFVDVPLFWRFAAPGFSLMYVIYFSMRRGRYLYACLCHASDCMTDPDHLHRMH